MGQDAGYYVSNYAPSELLITPKVAFATKEVLACLDVYESSNPTAPRVGRIWSDGKRICWTEHDFRDNSMLIHKVPYEVYDVESIAYLRRYMGVDTSSVLVNSSPPPQLGGQGTMDETLTAKSREILVSISIRIPNTGLTSVLDQVRPVIDLAAQVEGASTTISIQPYNPDDE